MRVCESDEKATSYLCWRYQKITTKNRFHIHFEWMRKIYVFFARIMNADFKPKEMMIWFIFRCFSFLANRIRFTQMKKKRNFIFAIPKPVRSFVYGNNTILYIFIDCTVIVQFVNYFTCHKDSICMQCMHSNSKHFNNSTSVQSLEAWKEKPSRVVYLFL